MEQHYNKIILNKISNIKLLKEVWNQVDQKKKMVLFFLLSLISAITDAINIGMLIPFLRILETPEIFESYFFYNFFSDSIKISYDPRIIILILFVSLLITGTLFRVYINWYTLKISYSISEQFASRIYENVLYKNYLEHSRENSSKTLSNITYRVNATTNLLMSFVIIFNNLSLSAFIIFTLLYINTLKIGTVIFSIGIIYISITYIFRRRFNENSRIISENQTSLLKTLQEGLGGIKEVILSSSQPFFIKEFNKSYSKLNSSLLFNNFFAQSPKLFIETFSILILLSFYYYSIVIGRNLSELIGLIGVLAFGAQKLIPSFQLIYQNWSNVTSNKYLVMEVLKILKNNLDKTFTRTSILYERKLKLNINTFRYNQNDDLILKDVNLTILKGEKIGIIGPSGSGKSTLINLMVGLLANFDGYLEIDNEKIYQKNIDSWRNQISYVPQNVFLFDSNLKSNITFGSKYNKIKNLNEIVSKVKLNSFVRGRKLDEIEIGERANKISGGEKQRIALARALYKNASLIVIDEATNALDKKIEKEIFDIIYNLDHVSIIVISHELNNLYGCSKIYELKDKTLMKYEKDI